MTAWMLWSIFFALLIALSATAAERIAAQFALPRRVVWMASIVACAVIPPVLASRRAHTVQVMPRPVAKSVVRAAPGLEAPTKPAAVAQSVKRAAVLNATTDTWAVRIWLLLSIGVLSRFAYAAIALRRRSAGWRETYFTQCSALVASDVGPAVVGFFRPRVVVPEWVLTVDEPTREMILRHELEHLRARDPQTLFACGMMLIALPWNLPCWWIVNRLRIAMELDCDARVVRAVGMSYEYGKVLLAVGERHTTAIPLAVSLIERRPLLERRINAMIMSRPRRPLVASLPFAALAFVAMTAATRAPHPAPLRAMSSARLLQPYPTADVIAAMLLANVATLSSPTDTSDYAIVVLDADYRFVMATAGSGSVIIQVWGDSLDRAARALRTAERTGVPVEAARNFGPRGRGAGSGTSVGGRGDGPAVAVRRIEFENGVVSFSPDSADVSPAFDGRPANAYSAGMFISRSADAAAGISAALATNRAPGLHSLTAVSGDDSLIDGIPASMLSSLESYKFSAVPLSRRDLKVLVVTTKANAASR